MNSDRNRLRNLFIIAAVIALAILTYFKFSVLYYDKDVLSWDSQSYREQAAEILEGDPTKLIRSPLANYFFHSMRPVIAPDSEIAMGIYTYGMIFLCLLACAAFVLSETNSLMLALTSVFLFFSAPLTARADLLGLVDWNFDFDGAALYGVFVASGLSLAKHRNRSCALLFGAIAALTAAHRAVVFVSAVPFCLVLWSYIAWQCKETSSMWKRELCRLFVWCSASFLIICVPFYFNFFEETFTYYFNGNIHVWRAKSYWDSALFLVRRTAPLLFSLLSAAFVILILAANVWYTRRVSARLALILAAFFGPFIVMIGTRVAVNERPACCVLGVLTLLPLLLEPIGDKRRRTEFATLLCFGTVSISIFNLFSLQQNVSNLPSNRALLSNFLSEILDESVKTGTKAKIGLFTSRDFVPTVLKALDRFDLDNEIDIGHLVISPVQFGEDARAEYDPQKDYSAEIANVLSVFKHANGYVLVQDIKKRGAKDKFRDAILPSALAAIEKDPDFAKVNLQLELPAGNVLVFRIIPPRKRVGFTGTESENPNPAHSSNHAAL